MAEPINTFNSSKYDKYIVKENEQSDIVITPPTNTTNQFDSSKYNKYLTNEKSSFDSSKYNKYLTDTSIDTSKETPLTYTAENLLMVLINKTSSLVMYFV